MGAVTIMSEEDALKILELIQGTFVLANAEEAMPDSSEQQALAKFKSGDSDYQPSMTQDNLKEELGM